MDEFFALSGNSVSDTDRTAVMMAGVAALEISTDPFWTAERLLRFGKEVEAPAAELLMGSSSPDARFMAALILIHFGSRLGMSTLLQRIEEEGDWHQAATFALVEAGIADHVPFLFNQLRRSPAPSSERFPTTDDDVALSLLEMLAKLRAPLPEDLRRKFSDPKASQYFRSIVETHGFGESKD